MKHSVYYVERKKKDEHSFHVGIALPFTIEI